MLVMPHVKHATPDHPILAPIAERWSPYVFDHRPVAREKPLRCLDAVRSALQAAARGLQAHQMAGVNLAKVRQTYAIPDGYDPMTAIAVGYSGPPPGGGDPQLAPRDATPRSRKPLAEFVFSGSWGQP